MKNNKTILKFKLNKNNKDNLDEELVNSVIEDFKDRQQKRKSFETSWKLNLNFVVGNQYCGINGNNDVVNYDKQFYWQEKEVYNHIAPLIELRLSKLSRVRPTMAVVPFSDDENDVECAKISKNILKATSYKLNLSKIISQATEWSEICGTSFYKIFWNSKAGSVVGKTEDGENIYEGDIDISVVNPFEIFPDSNSYENVQDCESIIHAKCYSISDIKSIWGVDVEGEELDIFTFENTNSVGGLGYSTTAKTASSQVKKDTAIVLEKYVKPTCEFPNGRLIIVAGNKLVFNGELPFNNLENEQRGYPFIKQCSIFVPSCFWGNSVVERCIPIQRAYNAVKNRKHEFLNRLSMGVLAVEDGSVDTENLEEEGLSPGKVLIYRQGSNIPKEISSGSVPMDFTYEEERLLNEFITTTGVNDLLNNTTSNSNISGVALQLLIEQDEARLLSSAEEIRESVKELSKHILRLFKQFAIASHASKLIGENGSVEMFYWSNADITSDEVIFETENELNESLAQKRSMIFEILNSGLLHDENGKLSNSMRYKVLEQLGFGVWDNSQDLKALQNKKAIKENFKLLEKKSIDIPNEIDDHDVHIQAHTCFMLGEEFEKAKVKNSIIEQIMINHIKEHKNLKLIATAENQVEV